MKKFVAIVFCILLMIVSGCEYDAVNVSKERDRLRDLQAKEKEPQVFDGELEPRMPDDDENDKTLEGIDANKNGIRDDVEIYINRRFDDPDYRRAFKQYAQMLQNWLIVSDRPAKEVAKVNAEEWHRTSLCFNGLFGNSSLEWKRREKLDDEIYSFQFGSSSLRKEANEKAWRKMTGQHHDLWDGPYQEACKFKFNKVHVNE